MAKHLVLKDATSRTEYVFIQDSSVTTGAGKTGLVFNTGSLAAYYVRPVGSATVIALITQTVTGAYSSGGFVEVDPTNMPGVYRVDIPNAVFAAGVDKAVVMLKGAASMAPVVLEYQLTGFDPAALTWMASYTQPTGFLAATFPGTVASTTNITAATGIVLSGVTHTSAVIPTVSAVTGLTAANLDTTVSSRMATYTQPTGFLAATFPAGTVANTTNITGGIITTVAAVTGLTAANLDAAISTRATPAQVNTEVVDALNVDTYAEPGTGLPIAAATLAAKINYLYKAWRNKKTQTSTTISLFNDDAATVDQKMTISDDGTTMTTGEVAAGP